MERPYLALIVDDNAASAEMASAALCKNGYEVLHCSNGLEAIEMAAEHRPDVILLDVKLPGCDGMGVCRSLKENEGTAPIPIIFVTAISEADIMLQAFDAGGADYITKPYRTAEVLARVSVHAKLHRAEEALRRKKRWTEERAKELTEANVQLESLSRIDPLTNLLNRRAWEEAARKEHGRFERHESTYSLLVIDVDQFKNFNDSLGHQAGDDCLRKVAEAIQTTCRDLDQVGRYGGEEFVVLAPETGVEDGFRLAERIRKAVWALGIEHPASSTAERITASTGVASAGSDGWEETLKRADDAMYVAKKAGRNMVYADHQSRQEAHDDAPDRGLRTAAVGDDDVGATHEAAATDSMSGATYHAPKHVPSQPAVLIVDDNPNDRSMLRGVLERADFSVAEAHNGEQALAMVTDRSCGEPCTPDVIVMDVAMPGIDGLECTRQLRGDPDAREIPILIVSAHDEDRRIVEGLRVGADEYLSKPIRPEQFVLRVQSLAKQHRERSHLMHSYAFRGEKTRILGSILDFARLVGAGGTLHHVLKHTLEVTSEVTSSSRVAVMLPNASREYLSIAQSIGIDDEEARRLKVPIGDMISGYVYSSQKPLVINHQWEARFQRPPQDATFFDDLPLVSVPLLSGTEVIGVLNVTERFGRRAFDTQHTEAIDLIANIAGAAIHVLLRRSSEEIACDATIHALARLAEQRTFDVGRHLERVARYSGVLAQELRDNGDYPGEVDDAFVRQIRQAVPLHDIGKLGLPDQILLKPGKLTADERRVMQSHATLGAEAIRSATPFSQNTIILDMAAQIAQSHHEAHDGSGYPEGLSGAAIPLAARITSLVDAYDALTTQRIYRDRRTHEEAVRIIKEQSGGHFDPVLVTAFLRCQGQFELLAMEMRDRREIPKPPPVLTAT